jgi:hypothetical protein
LLRNRVFVSYSHKDAEWLVHLKNALAPDIRNHRIHYFDDRGIGSGEPWYGTIILETAVGADVKRAEGWAEGI